MEPSSRNDNEFEEQQRCQSYLSHSSGSSTWISGFLCESNGYCGIDPQIHIYFPHLSRNIRGYSSGSSFPPFLAFLDKGRISNHIMEEKNLKRNYGTHVLRCFLMASGKGRGVNYRIHSDVLFHFIVCRTEGRKWFFVVPLFLGNRTEGRTQFSQEVKFGLRAVNTDLPDLDVFIHHIWLFPLYSRNKISFFQNMDKNKVSLRKSITEEIRDRD